MINFTTALANRLNEYKERNKLTYFSRFAVEVQSGQRYDKVFAVEVHDDKPSHNQRRIVAFVDKISGDIFKPASFKVPAKHARGNIRSAQHGMEAIDESGHVIYLR